MDVFKLHKSIIGDYKSYIKSFIDIRDDDIRSKVEEEVLDSRLWPEPLIQFNPNYAPGVSINDLIDNGIIHPDLNKIFRGYTLHKHQSEAILKGNKPNNKGFVVTSGTGSGKSLTYLATIFNDILQKQVPNGNCIAVIVYPMNALINSQFIEIQKYAEQFGADFPITFKKYTGQESDTEKIEIQQNPPHILLTNYMMLELILTRLKETKLKDNILKNIAFLVFDELHTYRGRQGADVGMLVRRLKSQTRPNNIVCIGTSATMASVDPSSSNLSANKIVADVASKFFDVAFNEEDIITESLQIVSNYKELPDKASLKEAILTSIPDKIDEAIIKGHPFSGWLELTAVVAKQGDYTIRRKPRTQQQIVTELCEYIGITEADATDYLISFLQWAEKINKLLSGQKIRRSYFAYKIHQFINQAGSVYVTLEAPAVRDIKLEAITKSTPDQGGKPYFQVVYSRLTGYDFLCVTKDGLAQKFRQRVFKKTSDDDVNLMDGFLILQEEGKDEIWDPERDIENLPENWIEYKKGVPQAKKDHKYKLPEVLYVDSQGHFFPNAGEGKLKAYFISIDSPLDITSFTVYDSRTNEGTMYTSLGNEGRSTSTDILTFSTISRMAEQGIDWKNQKVLSFTDNRQDTALQSGHFNDFIKVGQLRSAIYRALDKSKALDYTTITDAVFSELHLDINELVLKVSDTNTYQHEENLKALKSILTYKIFYDLRRGWRVIMPNLEQCALLKIQFQGLEKEVTNNKWNENGLLASMTTQERFDFFHQILDYFRKHNATYFSIFRAEELDKNYRIFKENLKSSWLYSPNEKIQYPYHIRVESTNTKKRNIYSASLGARSAPGRYIKEIAASVLGKENVPRGEKFDELVTSILDGLSRSGLLVKQDGVLDVSLYQLNGIHILWTIDDGTKVQEDKIKNPSFKNVTPRVNEYFKSFYQANFNQIKHLEAGEHSGQLKNEQRIVFEEKFREGRLKLLCCSPTMELGIDISDLSVVHMRNVPPDPSNYAQRSGRAGRSGQPALIFSYCSAYSAHDQHYFENRLDMVAGIVNEPKFDFSNEELIKTHLHSEYLAEVGMAEMSDSVAKMVTEIPGNEFLNLQDDLRRKLNPGEERVKKVKQIFLKATSSISISNGWLDEKWVDRMLHGIDKTFDAAIDRWRKLYKDAKEIVRQSSEVENDVTIPAKDPAKVSARKDRLMAQRMIDNLRNVVSHGSELSEFYPYRYFASEGFLPGYNFHRLPVRIFVPHNEGQYIARPRHLALREFGPRNRIYYMGGKYQVKSMPVNQLSDNYKEAKIAIDSGYILVDEELHRNTCPFTHSDLTNDNNRLLLTNLILLQESRAEEMGRITCEEEERISQGFEISTYFAMKGNAEKRERLVLYKDDDEYLEISFVPAASLYKVNHKWRNLDKSGFYMGENSGIWLKPGEIDKRAAHPNAENIQNVKIYTTETADMIYIKPLKNLNLAEQFDGALTLLYAIKRGIEKVFQVEPREIGAEIMGKEDEPNLMIYESAEGSLGVLKRFVRDIKLFKRVIHEAWSICHFDLSETEQAKYGTASYHDLLSYYNQFYHEHIDRYLITDALKNLMQAEYRLLNNDDYQSYEEHYEGLKMMIDPTSSTEKNFLDYLYNNQLRLPDKAQVNLAPMGCNTKPDFLYSNDLRVAIYCDGTPHDHEEARKMDAARRKCVENLGFEVVVWHYLTPLEEFVKNHPHIFIKVINNEPEPYFGA